MEKAGIMLYINIHEPSAIKSILSLNVNITIKDFAPGDYVFQDTGIERKSFSDFLGSIKSKRLFKQLDDLRYHYSTAYLIIELPFIENIINLKSLYRNIILIQNNGIKVLFSTSVEHTADIILLMYHMKMKYKKTLTFLNLIKYIPKDQPIHSLQVQILASFPGIGRKSAEKLLKRYKNLKKVFNASDSSLLKTKIIGQKKIESLRDILSTNFDA